MVAETCNQCGLPNELCVCDDMEKSESPDVYVSVEDAGFRNKKLTVVKGVTEEDVDNLDTKLKSALGTGGNVETGDDGKEIHLQGDQRDRDKLRKILEDNGYTVHLN